MAFVDQIGHRFSEVQTGSFELVLPRSNGWTNEFRDTDIELCGDFEITYEAKDWDGNIPWMLGFDEVGSTMTNWNQLQSGIYILQRPGNYARVYSIRNGNLVYEGIDFGTANGATDGHFFTMKRTGNLVEWIVDGFVVRSETQTVNCVNPACIGYYSTFWNGTGKVDYEVQV